MKSPFLPPKDNIFVPILFHEFFVREDSLLSPPIGSFCKVYGIKFSELITSNPIILNSGNDIEEIKVTSYPQIEEIEKTILQSLEPIIIHLEIIQSDIKKVHKENRMVKEKLLDVLKILKRSHFFDK